MLKEFKPLQMVTAKARKQEEAGMSDEERRHQELLEALRSRS